MQTVRQRLNRCLLLYILVLTLLVVESYEMFANGVIPWLYVAILAFTGIALLALHFEGKSLDKLKNS